jgi:conjugal transfer pilus assembly protein TraF
MKKFTLPIFCLGLVVSQSWVQHVDAAEPTSRGWHFYSEKPEPEPVEPQMQEPAVIPQPTVIGESEDIEEELEPMSVAWIKKYLPIYRDAAINDPSPDNVSRFYLLQRAMMDKAERFANAAQTLVPGNAYLDESIRRPLSQFGVNAMDKQSGIKKQELLKTISAKAGLWYFFLSTCPYCQAQSPVLKSFAEQFGFSLLPVSMDGGPDPAGSFDTFRNNTNQAQTLGIDTTPTMVLVSPGLPPEIIAIGLTSFSQLEDQTITAANRMGLINEGEALETKAVRQIGTQVSFDDMPLSENATASEIVEYLKRKMGEM